MNAFTEMQVRQVQEAADVLRRGGLVAFPTETVYGLGADATNESAVRRVFEVKNRPRDHPLIVHAASRDAAFAWARDVGDRAFLLAQEFWPGPLTLVLRRGLNLPPAATGGHDTVALRVPDHPIARELLSRASLPVAAPSANRFGQVSPTCAEHVRKSLGNMVETILDGGSCDVGVESTIIGLTDPDPVLLRPGGLDLERIESVLDGPLMNRGVDSPAAPGTLKSHYAPRCLVEIVAAEDAETRCTFLERSGRRVRLLEPSGSPKDDARSLYGSLRTADDEGTDVIVAVIPSREGIGLALADRLTKAAAPRPSSSSLHEEPNSEFAKTGDADGG